MSAESVDISAGLGGFLAFFLLAVALYFLMRNMNARLRRLAYHEEQAARSDQGQGQPPEAGPDDGPKGPEDGPKGGLQDDSDLG
jgi:hypothetical protein